MGEQKNVRRIALYVDNNLVVEATTTKYTHQSGDEQGHGFEGSDFWSDGNDLTMVDFTTITPAIGHEVSTMREAIVGKKKVTISLTVDGKVETLQGRMKERSYSSDSASGMVTCDWSFGAGAPTLLG